MAQIPGLIAWYEWTRSKGNVNVVIISIFLVVYDLAPTPLINKFIMMYILLQTLTKVQFYTVYVPYSRLVLLK